MAQGLKTSFNQLIQKKYSKTQLLALWLLIILIIPWNSHLCLVVGRTNLVSVCDSSTSSVIGSMQSPWSEARLGGTPWLHAPSSTTQATARAGLPALPQSGRSYLLMCPVPLQTDSTLTGGLGLSLLSLASWRCRNAASSNRLPLPVQPSSPPNGEKLQLM